VSRYLGIDYGAKRVGLATANSDAMLASPLRTVAPHELIAAIQSAGPFEVIVVGLPRGLDGQDTPAAREHGTRELLEKLGASLA